MPVKRKRRTAAQVYADTVLGLLRQKLLDSWVQHLCAEWDVSDSRLIDDVLCATIFFIYTTLPTTCIAREEV